MQLNILRKRTVILLKNIRQSINQLYCRHIIIYMQKKNPIETIKDKLHEQENEIRLLKDLVVKGFKGIIGDSSSQNVSNRLASSAADDSEMSKSGMSLDELNDGTENYNGPELPLSVPNLF